MQNKKRSLIDNILHRITINFQKMLLGIPVGERNGQCTLHIVYGFDKFI